ncbi:PREDICTED: arrestin domain-containing protein 2 isoform X4 [Wasmannia auropunctata]|uniref:arrestin domain-containing protein 2 isoform X4 n=2 Tax=Wasmannia auropunctata TaxID=64793 RepID=UPI0005EEC88D|nr:PREDICTED: arrestin domain-containing protein 2 isoform X4 [Wasmannia auropunctata]
MGLADFRIVFDNPWSTYYSGQTVTGNIIVILNSTKKIRGIRVKVKGEANTHWATDKQEMDEKGQYRDETVTVTGHEEYFDKEYYLVGSASGGEIEIQSGEHKFPFTCSLPTNLPSSFESDFGHVRYTVKATLDRPWKFDHDAKSPFTVIAPLDLNREPRAAESVQQEMSKTFCCLWCSTPPLSVNFSLPVRGYVPGQSMPIKINIENLSNIVVNTVKLVLCKIVTFHATTPRRETKTEEIVVTEISRGPVVAGGTADYEQRLGIPPLPPSNLANCRIIDLEYNLKVEACVAECSACSLSCPKCSTGGNGRRLFNETTGSRFCYTFDKYCNITAIARVSFVSKLTSAVFRGIATWRQKSSRPRRIRICLRPG